MGIMFDYGVIFIWWVEDKFLVVNLRVISLLILFVVFVIKVIFLWMFFFCGGKIYFVVDLNI